MNARFWTWHNGTYVKLTLRPGEARHHHRFWPHEEGWASTTIEWSFDGSTVTRETVADGTDCDGRLTLHYLDTAALHQLAVCVSDADDSPEEQLATPDWTDAGRGQRDYTAEAMGY